MKIKTSRNKHEQPKQKYMRTFLSNGFLVGKVQDAGDVESGLGQIVQDEQTESQPGEVGRVRNGNGGEIDGGVGNARGNVLLLHLLEVELRVRVEPVGQLDDEEEFEHERHGHVGIVLPQGRHVEEEPLAENDVRTPQDRYQVEDQQLARFVELAHLHFG